VLFIDEAYALSNQSKDNESKDFGQEAIDELVEALTAHLGEFSCIVAGYPDDMEQFLEANDGLQRRFPQLNAIQLDNYNDKELKQIFLSQLDNIQLEEDLEDRLDYFFNKAYSLGFTSNLNAGFCVELAEAMKINMHSNQDKKLKIEHIPDEYKKFLPIKDQNLNIDDSIFEELDKMIGLQNVKDELRAIVNSIRVAMHKGDNITIDHYAFIGNPGTGKTTVAKIVGDIFKKMNLLNGKILITKDEDFIGGYVGDTPKKTEKTIQKAMGGVLFIDEAYSLIEASEYGKQAVSTLIQYMENKRGEFCVILAGYPDEIDELLKSNPGFSSRIKKIEFLDYNKSELLEIFLGIVNEKKLKITDEAKHKVKDIIDDMVKNKTKHFGNAREMRNLFAKIEKNMNNRIVKFLDQDNKNKDIFTIEKEDI